MLPTSGSGVNVRPDNDQDDDIRTDIAEIRRSIRSGSIGTRIQHLQMFSSINKHLIEAASSLDGTYFALSPKIAPLIYLSTTLVLNCQFAKESFSFLHT